MIASLRKRGSVWVSPALYGLGAFALINVGLISMQFWLTQPIAPRSITAETAELQIRNWLDGFHIAVKKESDERAYFVWAATLRDGNPVAIARMHERDRHITMVARLTISPEDGESITNMSEAESTQLVDELTLELSRARVAFSIVGQRISTVTVSRFIPIGAITEDVLSKSLDDIDSDINLARQAIRISLDRIAMRR